MKSKKINVGNQIIMQKIADSLSLAHLKKAEQDKIIFALMDVVSSKINMAVWGKLSEEKREGLKKAIKSGAREVLNYISSSVENFSELVENITRETISDFKKKRANIRS